MSAEERESDRARCDDVTWSGDDVMWFGKGDEVGFTSEEDTVGSSFNPERF